MSILGEVASYENVRLAKSNPPKTHEFVFVLNNPPGGGLEGFGTSFFTALATISTEAVDIEPFEVQVEEFQTSSVTMPYVEGIDHNSITVTLVEQTGYPVINMLTTWRDAIFNSGEGFGGVVTNPQLKDTVNPYSEYVRDAQLQFTPTQETSVPFTDIDIPNPGGLFQIQMNDIFPESIQEFNMDYSDDGEAIKYQVDFAVRTIDIGFIGT
jgi:hypothetical protein